MAVIDYVGFCIKIIGIALGIALYIRDAVLPCNIIPPLSTLLDETKQLLHRAEVAGAISPQSDHRSELDQLMDQFVMIRMESNRALGIYQQLRLVIWCGLTYRLSTLDSKIRAIKSNLEIAIDQQHLDQQRLTNTQTQTQSTIDLVVATPAGGCAIPLNTTRERR
ncbi:hypothetical protein BC827DRAFT_1174499 [Russula dissimulans]|nr:hypothetical protein BC827DRAFT_1174499 [Russula dissimulans]